MPGRRAEEQPANMIVVISGASGSGKTSIATRVMEMVPGSVKSISYTTRAPREGENPGVSYHFVSKDEFMAMVKAKEFVEWAEVHGNLYGTSDATIERQLDDGKDVICDIDVQGGASLRKKFGPRAVLVFVVPPSWEVLEQRLRGRGTESEEAIKQRLADAREEHAHATDYDYIVVNADMSAAIVSVADIVRAERLRTVRARSRLPAGLLGTTPRRRS